MDGERWDAIVLAGGGSRRLHHTDKTALDLDGATLLERVLAAVAGAGVLVVVGDERPLPRVDRDLRWCRENPAGGGPVAGLAAGLAGTDAPVVVVLAADVPFVAPAVPVLLGAVTDHPAVLVDPGGRVNHLAAAWPRDALASALAALRDVRGAAMRSLTAAVEPVLVLDRFGWGEDCDTWADVRRARERSRGQATDSSPA